MIAIRDILKLGKTRAEVKKIIGQKLVLLNGKEISDDKLGIGLFDILSFPKIKKAYKLVIQKTGKFWLVEVKETEVGKKISKIIGKKILKGKKIQLNISDGRNILSDTKCAVGDSVVLNIKEKRIEKCLPLKNKAKIFLFGGKHIGEEGEILELNENKTIAKTKADGKEINVLTKQLIVIE